MAWFGRVGSAAFVDPFQSALKQMHTQDLTEVDRELYNREIKVMK